MSVLLLLAERPFGSNNRILTKRIATALMAFLFLALSPTARAAPPKPAPPPFPVGWLSAFTVIISPGAYVYLTWTATLPENANSSDYVFFIRQKQMPTGIQHDTPVQGQGSQGAYIGIEASQASFELWAVKSTSPVEQHLLDTITVGIYLPMVSVKIRTEDSYSTVPRTRADRPIFVELSVAGMPSDPQAPEESKAVTLHRHVQSYGATGTGYPLNRDLATLLTQSEISSNGLTTISLPANSIPGENRAKVRGEERFTILSKEGYQTPESIIDSKFVQVWPVADATISGISEGQVVGENVPGLSFQLNDLYPSSTTWAQVYKGEAQAGITGTTLPGSSVVINGSVPQNRTVTIVNYGWVFDSDGLWTMELLTRTPFGTDRLAMVSFQVEGSVVTLADWRQLHFGSESNSGEGADENDYDKDGIVNLIEFAFGLNPKQSSAGQLPMAERLGEQFTIRFTPPAGIADVLYGAEWSSTLQPGSWQPVTNTGALPEHVFSVSATDRPQVFLRLKATSP